jgi:hypothetical protein
MPLELTLLNVLPFWAIASNKELMENAINVLINTFYQKELVHYVELSYSDVELVLQELKPQKPHAQLAVLDISDQPVEQLHHALFVQATVQLALLPLATHAKMDITRQKIPIPYALIVLQVLHLQSKLALLLTMPQFA